MVIPSIPTVADSLGSIRISIGSISVGSGGAVPVPPIPPVPTLTWIQLLTAQSFEVAYDMEYVSLSASSGVPNYTFVRSLCDVSGNNRHATHDKANFTTAMYDSVNKCLHLSGANCFVDPFGSVFPAANPTYTYFIVAQVDPAYPYADSSVQYLYGGEGDDRPYLSITPSTSGWKFDSTGGADIEGTNAKRVDNRLYTYTTQFSALCATRFIQRVWKEDELLGIKDSPNIPTSNKSVVIGARGYNRVPANNQFKLRFYGIMDGLSAAQQITVDSFTGMRKDYVVKTLMQEFSSIQVF